jgi:hypothetical protein
MGILDFFRKAGTPRKPKKPFTDVEMSRAIRGDYERFRKKMMDSSLIMLITGKRGSGKTSLGMKLLEVFSNRSSRECYIVNYRKARLPKWMHRIDSVEDAPNNAVVLIDEGAVGYFSRESMKEANRVLSKIMTLARHKNLSLLIISQNSAMIDLNVVRLSDTLLFKEPSLLQARFERRALKDMFDKVTPFFKKLEDPNSHFYVWDDDFEGMISYDLPGFWTESISTSFRDFGRKKQ